ncbi:hypothetical protein JVU11DRAFT_2820 [Chiua virens]|nr:hypothetical protein JVU11DRAFT_2820 [Chiua virens]
MPESMFGRPSQHLLPSHPSSRHVTPASHTPPVPPRFEDVRFNVIGKPPGLLSRISVLQPDHADYHSPTPSPTSTPPPPFANNGVSQLQSSSRPTLFQQLADRNSSTMDAPSQSNASLASRIQMDVTPSSRNPASATNATIIGSPSRSQGTDGNDALIPPVEVLPQVLDSSAPPTPTCSAPAPKLAAVHDTMSSAPSVGPSNTAASNGTEPFPSFAVVDAIMRDMQRPSYAVVPIDSSVARQERLQAISANLANLTSPLPLPSSHSSSPDPSSVVRVNENTTPEQPSDSQHTSNPIVLRYPYPANQSSGRLELSINDPLSDASDSALTSVPSPETLTKEYKTHRRALMEAFKILNSTHDAAHRAQIDSEHALAQRIRTFEEQRAVFEQMRQAEAARLQRESQELHEKREELNAKEASLASLEKESKAREDARKVILARRQAREEEKRAADAKRNQEVQEQIAAAIKELKEIESLKARWQDQLGQSVETLSDDLPTEPQNNMNEDEKRIIMSRNELLRNIKDIRLGLAGGVQQLEEYDRTLRGLEVERKRREAEETERRRIAGEECLRVHAEAERARQVQDQNRRPLEAERKRREAGNDREQARLLHEQQAHAEAQARRLGRPATTSSQIFMHRSHLEGGSSQQQATDTTRIRTAREVSSLSQEVAEAMQVEEDDTTSAPHRAVSVPDTQPGSGRSQPALSSKGKKPIPGGVMLATSTPKAAATHLPPKPSGKTLSSKSSDQVGGKTPNFANASLAVSVPTEGGDESSFPAQLASEFNRALSADVGQTPDHRTPFPRTPKSKTILDVTHGENQELNIGPAPGVSPTQQNVNLRHLKRSRGRVDESDSGDGSVRNINGKNEEIAHPHVKQEEHDISPKLVPASVPTNPLASLLPRPTVIPPPRLRKPKKHDGAPESPSYPLPNNELSLKKEEASVTIDKRASSQRSSGSQAMNIPPQLPVPAEIQNSLLLGPVHPEGHSTESRPNAGERLTQDCSQNHVTPSPISAIATLSYRLDGEDLSRKNKRFSDEHHRAPGGSSSQRLSDHRSPPPYMSRPAITSPTQSHRLVDSARQPNASSGPRVEPMRVPSPVMGKKRPSEHDDNEHGHRARRQRGDHWVAPDFDHGRVDSYRSHRDRRNDSDEERRATHRVPLSPPDRIRSYPSDIPMATHDNKKYTSPSPEGLAAPFIRWEQSSRRLDNDDIYQWYPPSAPTYRTTTDQHRMDDIRVGQTHDPMAEERMEVQSDPSLLARMTSSQHHPPSTNYRGRGRGDLGRGRGRSAGRGGPPLLDRITSGPSSLEDRLT